MKLIPWFFAGLLWIPFGFSYRIQHGFFGTIGPNLKLTNIQNLVELFTGNGVIQGVFFKNGTPQFVRHVINTRKNQREPITREPMMITVLKYILYKMRIFPYNNIGVANTALYPLSDRVDENTTAMYAMYERDLPYLVHLYHNTSSIATIKQMDALYPEIQEISGHSKSLCRNRIETLDYHVLSKRVDYYQLAENMRTIFRKHTIKMRYLPIVHDFVSTETSIVVMDSPLRYDFFELFRRKIPVVFGRNVSTFVHVLNKRSGDVETYEIPWGQYVFHYGMCWETENHLHIYAPIYDDLDFSTLNIQGKYRKMVIDRISKTIRMETNSVLEKMNLDFPIAGPDGMIVLRSIENRRMNGFVMVKGLNIAKTWIYEDLSFCGEHGVLDNSIMAFCIKNDSNYLCVIDMGTDEVELIECPYDLTMGFHSVFV